MHNSTEDIYDLIYSSKDYQKESTEIKDFILS
jgi:hypothetical protein